MGSTHRPLESCRNKKTSSSVFGYYGVGEQFVPGQREQLAIAGTAPTGAPKMSMAVAVTVSWKHTLPGVVELAPDG